jgi:cell division protein FtsB
MKKIYFVFLICISSLFAISTNTSDIYKEKQDLLEVKDELNSFYEQKELEYQKQKKELEKIHKSIMEAQKNIEKFKQDNQNILDEINRVTITKSMNMYDKMKIGVIINIFNEMLNDGEIDKVYDIMIRMKEKKVMKIMKKLDVKTSTIIMKKMSKKTNDKK